MKRLYTLFLITSLSLASAIAQDRGTGIIGNYYYRVRNAGQDRYVYVRDNYDESDIARQQPDFGAIELWKDASKTISDPGSVIYVLNKGGGYFDLQAQGTGVEKLTKFNVHIRELNGPGQKGLYEVYVTKDNVTQYLDDERTITRDDGELGIHNKDQKYRCWIVDKIETDHATNYFGVKPTIQLNGKYYRPFYADFPFKLASPGMHVYYVNSVKGDEAVLKEVEGEIAAGTPVVIECASENPSNNRLELLYTKPADLSGNKLAGIYFCNQNRGKNSKEAYKVFDASAMRLLTIANGKLVLSNNENQLLSSKHLQVVNTIDWDSDDEDEVSLNCIPANTCYLMADAGTPATLNIRFEGVGIDEILAEKKDKSAEGVYTLSGTQLRATNDVQGLPAGLYIVGGVKFAIK